MPNKIRRNLSSLKDKIYVLEQDKDTNTIIPRDDKGVILNGEQIDALIQGLAEFKKVNSNESLAVERSKALQESGINKYWFLQPTHKKGYVFIYKELITNKYRIVATQDYEKRIKTLQYEYPTSLEVVAKSKTTDVNILKEVMTNKYQQYHSHENWFDLTQEAISYFKHGRYQQEFNERIEAINYEVYDKIICDNCKKVKTNLDQKYYFMCILCRKTYCSEECLYETQHQCI